MRNAEDGKEAIQLKPQEMTIKLRPSEWNIELGSIEQTSRRGSDVWVHVVERTVKVRPSEQVEAGRSHGVQ